MKDIDWSKAPEGTTHAGIDGCDDIQWYKDVLPNGGYHYWAKQRWYKEYGRPVTRWVTPRPTPWQGPQDGLPPEGTNCRVVQTINNYMVCKDATITYQGDGVGCYINNDNGMEYSVSHYDYSFRIIETEKDKATYELARDLGDICPMPEVVNKVIDLGYRKPMSRLEAQEILTGLMGRSNWPEVNKYLDALGYKE